MVDTTRFAHPRPGLIATFGPVVGACHYLIGDILLLAAEPDPERFTILRDYPIDESAGAMLPFSNERLALGAAIAPFAVPWLLPVGSQRRRYLREGGAPRWVGDTAFWGYGIFTVVSPVIHLSFFPWALLLKAAQREADRPNNQPATDRAIARVVSWNKKMETLYGVAFAALIAASVAEGVAIWNHKSRYPRWSAALVTPIVPMAVSIAATAKGTGRHPAWRSLQGAGFSLGEIISFTAGGLLARRR